MSISGENAAPAAGHGGASLQVCDVPVLAHLRPGERDAFAIYLGFLVRAIMPSGCVADDYFRRHSVSIEQMARRLREIIGYAPRPLYRGLILRPGELDRDNILRALPRITYLSFSESRAIAHDFADMYAPISALLRAQKPDGKGYLIAYTASADEVLFSWRWADLIGLNDLGVPGWSADLVYRQQEVILRQRGRRFRAKMIHREAKTP